MPSLNIDFVCKLPKCFVKDLSIKHIHCHLHDGVIRTLHHSILYIHGGHLLLDAMILQKMVDCVGINSSSMSDQIAMILYSNCVFTSALNSLNF